MRRINHYLIEINKRLVGGGVFVGRIEPLNLRFKRYKNKYPHYLALFFYFFDFLWNRVFPKLPFIHKFYFLITNGKNRAISLAECLGRISYCGFSVNNLREMNGFVYFIVNKIGAHKKDISPSYGPLIKLKRVGKGGEQINVYKLRTMYPYSEYLQEFTYNLFGSKTGDKINDDFRVTSWGKIIRKYWLDELPMLINLIKGELKIVGVRPLSYHKFSIYPEDYRQERIKYKPGLVPPYYYDLPQNFKELVESEKKYLYLFEQNPIITDIKYFFKSFYNIIIKKARSG
jgi:lipopolysaccharide/colanic/teichoic acid biosynthesis glycosyltransferase